MNNKKFGLPIGKAQALNRLAEEEPRRTIFLEVENRALLVNTEVYFPLRIQEGKSTPLGLFAERTVKRRSPVKSSSANNRILDVWQEHHRSALLGRAVFSDKKGRLYRDIDLKGIGYIYCQDVDLILMCDESDVKGLLDDEFARFDYQLSEEFLKAGIRTHRVIAIIKLREVIYNGDKTSIKKLKKTQIISRKFNPVIGVRAFGTKARIEDLSSSVRESKEGLLIKDAKMIVASELGRKNKTLSDRAYLLWYAETAGKNIGLMHKNGWVHGYVTKHNLTLDCRIVDLDSVGKLENENECKEDIGDALRSIGKLSEILNTCLDDGEIDRLFQKGYNSVFSPKARKRYFARLKKARRKAELIDNRK